MKSEGYREAMKEVYELLGLSFHDQLSSDLKPFINSLLQQAIAWQLLSHLTNPNVAPMVASNQLAREIEKFRGNQ